MAQHQMTYEEFAEDLANAYPDLDLQDLTVDDIKIMMGHALKIEPNKYGLTPISECPPTRRRRRSRQRSRLLSSASSSADDLRVGEPPRREPDSDEEAYAAAAFLEQNMNRAQDVQDAGQFGSLGSYQAFSDMSKLPLATVQALYASAALLSFSRGQSGVPAQKQPQIQGETVPIVASTQSHDSAASSSYDCDTVSGDNKSSSFNSTFESQDNIGVAGIKQITESGSAQIDPSKPTQQQHEMKDTHVFEKIYSSKESVIAKRTKCETKTSVAQPSGGHSEKLRQLLQVGYQELVHKWAEEEAEQNANNSAATSDKEAKDGEKEDNVEQLKPMNPGHLEDGVFKIPAGKISQQPHGLELDTPPPSQTLPVSYGYAPNVVIRPDTSLPLTPPQASPPEVNMAEMTSAQLSNLMSKHLLSTTHAVKTSAVLGKPLDGVVTSLPMKDLSQPMPASLTGIPPFVNTPTTQISYLPMVNVALDGRQTTTTTTGGMVGVNDVQAVADTDALQTSVAAQNLLPINGMFHTDTPTAALAQPKPTPKKSKKRRRKSDSSESLGSLGAPLDGSPRLIKKIGRVIQTVENEQDLNMKVDAMLKNIMGKFQQRQTENAASTSQSDNAQSPVKPQVGAVAQTGMQQKVLSAQAVPQPSGTQPVPTAMQPPKPSPKKRSRSKKKAPVTSAQSLTVNQTVLDSAATLGLQLSADPADGIGTSKPIHQQLIQLPPNLTSSEAIAAASIAALSANQGLTTTSQPQTLLQSIPTSGLTVNPMLISDPPTLDSPLNANSQNAVVSPQGVSSISAHQLMSASEALEAAKKMLLDAGITLPAVSKATPPFASSDQQTFLGLSSPASQLNSIGFTEVGVSSHLGATQVNEQVTGAAQVVTHKLVTDAHSNDSAPQLTSQTVDSDFMTSQSMGTSDNPPNTQPDIQNPKAKKRKKKPTEKLSETDIANIAQLLKMANSQYFAEFFNQLQAFALGKNPDWMRQYPNIASYMGLKSDSKDKAKQILDYMREQTGVPEGQEMVAIPNLATSLKSAAVSTVSNTPVIPSNSTMAPPMPSQGMVQKRDDSKVSQVNGLDGHEEASFIDSFQNFLHNKTTCAPPVSKAKRPSRSSKSSHTTSKAQSNVVPHLQSMSLISSTGLPVNPLNLQPSSKRLPTPVDTTINSPFKHPSSSDCNTVALKSIFGDNRIDLENSAVKDILQDNSLIERLKCNYGNQKEEIPKCDCLKGVAYDESKEGPYYTHLGAGPDVQSVRKLMESRLGLQGRALRIEKVLYTSKEGKSSQGCPVPRWILRRSGPEEKVLCVVRLRPGHRCDKSVLIIGIVVWEALASEQADSLYSYLRKTLPKNGGDKPRRRATAEQRICKCQSLNQSGNGATFNFGCGWSTFYSGCKFTKSTGNPRKFKIGNISEEPMLEQNLHGLASDLSPLCQETVPDAYKNMVQYEAQAQECRLGRGGPEGGRPFSSVRAEVGRTCHSRRQHTHVDTGCSMIVTLTQQDGVGRSDAEQLLVYPMYLLDTADELGSVDGQLDKLRSGAIDYISGRPPKSIPRKRLGGPSHGRNALKTRSSVLRKRRSKLIPKNLIERLNLKSVSRSCVNLRYTRKSFGKVGRPWLFRTGTSLSQSSVRHTPTRAINVQKKQQQSRRRNSKGKAKSGQKSGKTKRWQEMMNDPAFVNSLMTVGQKMYGPEAETMVGRLKSVAEQDRASQDASAFPDAGQTSTVCSTPSDCAQADSNLSDNFSRWEGWARRGACHRKGECHVRATRALRRPASTPLQDCQPMFQVQPAKRPRSCTPTADSTDVSKPEDVAGWGMYSMPPNRSVFDIDSPRKSISTELLRSVNRHGSQTRHILSPGCPVTASSTSPGSSATDICGEPVSEPGSKIASNELVNNGLLPSSSAANHNEILRLKQTQFVEHAHSGISQSFENGQLQNEMGQSYSNTSQHNVETEQLQTGKVTSPRHEGSHSLADVPGHGHSSSTAGSASQYSKQSSHGGEVTTGDRPGQTGVETPPATPHKRKGKRKASVDAADAGGVAIALTHGSVLFGVSRRELHATTTLRKRSGLSPCISLEFHQQKGLNLPRHGHSEYLQLEEVRRLRRDVKSSLKVEMEESEVEVKDENEAKVSVLASYKYLWEAEVVRANTQTTNGDVTYSWLKPQTAVSGPYQRWV